MIARCPFCGSDDVKIFQVTLSPVYYQCKCRKCLASGPCVNDATEAERRWSEIPYLSSRLGELTKVECRRLENAVYLSFYTDSPSEATGDVLAAVRDFLPAKIRECRG